MDIREPKDSARAQRRVPPQGIHDPASGARATMPPPPPPPPPNWRDEVRGLSGLNVIAGIWLIVAPWVLGYSPGDPRWNDIVFGAIVAILALLRATGAYRQAWLSWINALIGTWLIVAAFTIDHSTISSWNNLVVGAIVLGLALSSAEATANPFSPRRKMPPPMR
jgi:hypothetical protein